MQPFIMRNALKASAVVCAVIALAACGGGKKEDRYLTEVVAIGDVERTVLGTGTLQPFEVVNVGAQTTGQVQSLKVALGDQVRRGQLLAVIDPSTQTNQLRNAEAALVQAQAQKVSNEATLTRNELELARQASLVDRGYTSRASYDRADADLKVSRAQVRAIDAQIRQAEISVERAHVELARTNIAAPMDGVVAAVVVREGQTVNAVQTAPTIVRIAKLDVMTVKAQISEADVIRVNPGQSAFFTILGDPDKRYYATLRAVDPAPENAGEALTGQPNAPVYYSALFDVPNPDGKLRPAMTAQVNVILEAAKGALAMPAAGLGDKQSDGRYKVKVLGADGKTADRLVRVGVISNTKAQVLEGLKAGEKVVVSDSWDTSVSGAPQPKNKAQAKGKS